MIKEDPRNMGGRTVIVDKMVNHHKALLQAKSSLNTFRPNKPTMRKQPKAFYKHLQENQQVIKTF